MQRMFKIITISFDRNEKGFDEEVLTNHVQCFEDSAEKYWSVFPEYDPVPLKRKQRGSTNHTRYSMSGSGHGAKKGRERIVCLCT